MALLIMVFWRLIKRPTRLPASFENGDVVILSWPRFEVNARLQPILFKGLQDHTLGIDVCWKESRSVAHLDTWNNPVSLICRRLELPRSILSHSDTRDLWFLVYDCFEVYRTREATRFSLEMIVYRPQLIADLTLWKTTLQLSLLMQHESCL